MAALDRLVGVFERSRRNDAIYKSRSFTALFSRTPHVPNMKLRCFSSMSCGDDGPVRQTGSEAALKPENVATMARPS
jgi:hypothetical protein